MPTPSDDATPRAKRSHVKDLPAQPSATDDVSGGATIRSIIPCIKPTLDPCIKPATLPGGISNPIRTP